MRFVCEWTSWFQLPIDISKLSPEEQAALRRRRKPKTEIKVEKEIEDNYDRKKYVNFLKKKWIDANHVLSYIKSVLLYLMLGLFIG